MLHIFLRQEVKRTFWTIAQGLLIPFIGTALGSFCVFFISNRSDNIFHRAFMGLAAGVMAAASVWGLLVPSAEQSSGWGNFSFFPVTVGFCVGMSFLMLLDRATCAADASRADAKRAAMLALAVVLHNIPEGMAVGAVYAGFLSGGADITAASSFALALGVAVQNIPDGMMVAIPLASGGMKKGRACMFGVLSGGVELVSGLAMIMLSDVILPALPFLLSFAAGAMIYVVLAELIPEMSCSGQPGVGTVMFTVGFALMMIMDIALG